MTGDNLLYSILLQLKKQKDFIFFWNGRTDKEDEKGLIFTNPATIISAHSHDKIKDCFLQIECALSEGFYVAGFVSYEAAAAFEDALPKKDTNDFPLLWFGVYRKPLNFKGSQRFIRRPNYTYAIKNLKPTKSEKAYLADISKIKHYIRRGDTYQVNYTFKYKFDFKGCPYNMFYELSSRQSVPYAAFISFNNTKILSLSPELFISRKRNLMKMKPMKGTAGRGKGITEDIIMANSLRDSIKDRAENVMIVDMLRNDLSRISKTGTVKTTRLFETQRYQTLYQMTSTIKAKLKNKISWYEIFKSVFPSGSVTGAPKIRTMQIINELEKQPRNVYTGSIGYISPEQKATFNVAIRTVTLNTKANRGELGIGSGITISSDSRAELQECKLKSDFFIGQHTDFQLIETLLWQNGRFFLLNMHLKRLKDSADYFDYKYSRNYILRSLINYVSEFKKHESYKVRLLLNKGGEVKISSSTWKRHKSEHPRRRKFVKKQAGGAFPYVAFSAKKTDSSKIFLYHKTTNRKFYDGEYQKYKKKAFIDVIFCNKRGEVTEGAISNIIVKQGRLYYTPPISCGLLNGVYRQYLLNAQILPLKEKILYKKDVITAEKLFICNSVRGLTEVKI